MFFMFSGGVILCKKNVYLIRHGECVGNTVPMFGTDSPLTERGIEQCYGLESKLNFIKKDIGLVITSDFRRALDSSLMVFRDKNIMVIDRRFRELHFGLLEGNKVTEKVVSNIREQPDSIKTVYRGDDIYFRINDAINAIRSYMVLSPWDVAVVGHDSLFELILEKVGYYRSLGIPFKLWSEACLIPNCGYVKVDGDMFDGSFGNNENMIAGGVAVALNKGDIPGVTKRQLARAVNAQAAEIQNMKQSYESKIAELEAKVEQLVAERQTSGKN